MRIVLATAVGRAAEWLTGARNYGNGDRGMRVLLSTYGSRGDVEPMVALAVRMGAPPDKEFAAAGRRRRAAGAGRPADGLDGSELMT